MSNFFKSFLQGCARVLDLGCTLSNSKHDCINYLNNCDDEDIDVKAFHKDYLALKSDWNKIVKE